MINKGEFKNANKLMEPCIFDKLHRRKAGAIEKISILGFKFRKSS